MINTNGLLILGIPPYIFFVGIGLFFSILFYAVFIILRQKELARNLIIMFISSIGLLVGARIFGYLTNIGMAIYNGISLKEAFTGGAGIVFYGGLTGFVFSFILLQKILNKSIDKEIMNALAVSIPLFHSFARIGCFFAGCCYGRESNCIISVDYVLKNSEEVVARIPVQLIEATLNFSMFILMLFLLLKRKEKLLEKYFIIYASYRFVIEFCRGDKARGVFGPLSFSQMYSLLIIVTVILLWFRRKKTT